MATKSAADETRLTTIRYRRAIVSHLVRQSGGPTPDPRDALRFAQRHFGLVPRQANLGRFTARICRLPDSRWALDFNPGLPKVELVAAIWHELSELLCLSDEIVGFESLCQDCYRESAISAYDRRHRCAVGVERYVRRTLRNFPEVRAEMKKDRIRQILLARSSIAPTELIIPSIAREPCDDYARGWDDLTFPV